MLQVVKTNTAQWLGQALGTILIARGYVLKGVEANEQPLLALQVENDILPGLLRELEVGFYFYAAGLEMTATFGRVSFCFGW